jgi:hypothetical protein
MGETMLSLDNLFALAERESGAYGLADEGLITRVSKVVDWINAFGPYSRREHLDIQDQVKRLLVNRLKLAFDRQRFPQIAEEKIERPIFVVGFARSGTTLIHSLLAEDPAALAPQRWHMYSPSPPPGAGPVVPERIAFSQRQVEHWMDFCPAQKPMHPYIDKGAYQLIEDEELIALDFRTTYCYHYYKVPHEEILWVDLEPQGTFDFHRQFMQHVQWNTSAHHWVCKGTLHQGNLKTLFDFYPDALCIWAHRPISEILSSITLLGSVIYETISGKPGDLKQTGKTIAEMMKMGVDGVMADEMLDDPRLVHIPFPEIVADPLAVIRSIYARQDRELTPEFETRISAWLDAPENKVDRYGRYPYSYEALGLEQGWVEELFADYSQRFGLA